MNDTPTITCEYGALHYQDETPYRAQIATGDKTYHGRGKTQAHALANAAACWRHHEERQRELERAEPCPKCATGKLLCQPGGGVACNTVGCGYWFCY